jgi:hypothetical protein
MPINAFTISSNNYLGMARVFADSYLEHHPGSRVFVCLVDRLDERVPYEDFPFEIILAEDLGIPEFSNFAFRYDILELNTAVKPFVFKYLRDTVGLDQAFYFDPDILVHDRLGRLEEALGSHQAVLTPHLTEPLDNRCRPPERIIGMCGVYNLGFVGLQLNEGTSGFLDWWCDRLYRYCIVDLANGMFVDQSWMDFAPAYLESVAVVRDPIFNIAYWNLPHRRPVRVDDHWEVEGRRVGFFHFSGVDLNNLDIISRHQDRVDLWSRPELRPLFEEYRDLVDRSGQEVLREIPYHYGTFAGADIAIPWVARIALQETDPQGLRWPDPFAVDTDDSFLAWLAEPLELCGQMVNRAVLYLWQERLDVRKEFPDLVGEGHDLTRFRGWFVAKGNLEEGLHDIFTEALRSAPVVVEPDPLVAEIEEVARFDLSNPGERTAWLNEPVDDGAEPMLTRLSMVIHRACPDVAAEYPEPLGRQRQQFAYWFALEGKRSYGLHGDLVAPVTRTLPPKSRISLRLKELVNSRVETPRRPAPPPTETEFSSPTPHDSSPSSKPGTRVFEEMGRTMRASPSAGVNLVGFFDGSEGARSFAPAIREALRASEIPHVAVSLDHDLPDQMTSARLRHHTGAPFPVTVLVLPPEKWQSVLERLPVGCRLGSHVIGYCSVFVGSSFPSGFVNGVDEIWVPTEEMALELSGVLPIPVRAVPPYLVWPAGTNGRNSLGLDRNRFWFLALGCGSSEEDDLATSSAIECVRSLQREGDESIGLCLAVGPKKRDLERQLRHLPVFVFSEPICEETRRRLVFECDGFFDLNPKPMLEPIHLEAKMHGLPVISVWTGGSSASRPADVSTLETPEYRNLDIARAARAMRAVAGASDIKQDEIAAVREPALGCADMEKVAGMWKREVGRFVGGGSPVLEGP